MKSETKQLTVVVDKALPFGVFVTLEGGGRGYIRRREMSWEGDLDPQELVRPGQKIKAVVLDDDPAAGAMVLSHRAALPDPWLAFARAYGPGDSVTGTVKRLGLDTVWVQIQPGIYGSISLDELSPERVDKPEAVVWPGDDIVAVITSLQAERRQVRLSMRRRLAQLTVVASVMKNLSEPAAVTPVSAPEVADIVPAWVEEAPFSPTEITNIGRVLVVEDQDDLRTSLVRWLADHGLQVSGAAGIGQALDRLGQQDHGLCLVDIGLSGEDGLALIRSLQDTSSELCVAVMSTPEWLDRRSSEISRLGITAALAKPLDLAELESLLQSLARGECPRLAAEESSAGAGASVFFQPDRESAEQVTFQGRLQQTLESSLQATQAEKAVLFEMEMPGKTMTILAHAGRLPLNRDALYLLQHSPVEDVISEVEPITTDRVSAESTRRFEKLQPLLPFESCLGLPLVMGGEVRHALFYFHRKPNVFNLYRQRDARAAATLLAAHLERQAFDDRLLLIGDLLLSGRLASAFGHEVHNKMSAVELQGVNLRRDLGQLAAGSAQEMPEMAELQEGLDALIRSTLRLKDTVRRFQDLMRAEERWELDVNEVVRSAKGHLRVILEEQRIPLRLNLAAGLPLVPGNSQRLHYVILNLLLNAIQHMESKSPEERRLEVTTSYEPDQIRRPVRARIKDSGPGIHKQLWERIFQLGFSTRPDGTGLGLYIARSLVENMGGRITVERSVIGVGTTFLLTFPEAKREEVHEYGSD